eukprot:m.4680 g.4680  ORF g.4680 m.4680 type:complete len:59 (+) comp2274_c0_seq1:169-345(+)
MNDAQCHDEFCFTFTESVYMVILPKKSLESTNVILKNKALTSLSFMVEKHCSWFTSSG